MRRKVFGILLGLALALGLVLGMSVTAYADEDQMVSLSDVIPTVSVKVDVGAGHAGLFDADTLAKLKTATNASEATINGNVITLAGIASTTTQSELQICIDKYIASLRGEEDWLIHNKELYGGTGYKPIDKYASMKDVQDDIEDEKHSVPIEDNLTYYLLWMKPLTEVKLDNGNPICGGEADAAKPTTSAGTVLDDVDWSDEDKDSVETFEGGKEYNCEADIRMDPNGDYWRYFFDEDDLKVSVAGGEMVYLDVDEPWLLCVRFKVTAEHDWDDGTVTRQPTTTAEGEKLFKCMHCNAAKTESIPKLTPTAAVRGIAKGKKSLKFTWTRVDGAASYEVWMSKCNTAKKKYSVKKVKTLGSDATSFTKKKLKKHTAYKFKVVAKDASDNIICKSLTGHAITGNVKGRYTNARSLKVSQNSYALIKGGTAMIKATQKKAKKGKKLCNHAKLLRYTTSNPAVATVGADGTISAVGAGTCSVYVQTVNGIWKTVEISVN